MTFILSWIGVGIIGMLILFKVVGSYNDPSFELSHKPEFLLFGAIAGWFMIFILLEAIVNRGR